MSQRPANPVTTTELCSYGCMQTASYLSNSGRYLCSKFSNSCPAVKKKNSEKLKSLYATGEKNLAHFDGKRGWSKGKTKSTDDRVLRQANAIRGKRRITDEERLKKVIYYEQCDFNLAGIIQNIEGYSLLQEYGMYHKHNNVCGVVRDHIISKNYGFKNNIDPKIISHPANCRFITHKDNAKKSSLCDMTLDELIAKIEKWDIEGNWYTLLNESQ